MIREFVPADTDAVVALWRACDLVRPWNERLGYTVDPAVSMGKRLERDEV